MWTKVENRKIISNMHVVYKNIHIETLFKSIKIFATNTELQVNSN